MWKKGRSGGGCGRWHSRRRELHGKRDPALGMSAFDGARGRAEALGQRPCTWPKHEASGPFPICPPSKKVPPSIQPNWPEILLSFLPGTQAALTLLQGFLRVSCPIPIALPPAASHHLSSPFLLFSLLKKKNLPSWCEDQFILIVNNFWKDKISQVQKNKHRNLKTTPRDYS